MRPGRQVDGLIWQLRHTCTNTQTQSETRAALNCHGLNILHYACIHPLVLSINYKLTFQVAEVCLPILVLDLYGLTRFYLPTTFLCASSGIFKSSLQWSPDLYSWKVSMQILR